MTVRTQAGKLYPLKCRTLGERDAWRDALTRAVKRGRIAVSTNDSRTTSIPEILSREPVTFDPTPSFAEISDAPSLPPPMQRQRSVPAIVPAGAHAGACTTLNHRGVSYEVKIPEGVSPGDEFIVSIPDGSDPFQWDEVEEFSGRPHGGTSRGNTPPIITSHSEMSSAVDVNLFHHAATTVYTAEHDEDVPLQQPSTSLHQKAQSFDIDEILKTNGQAKPPAAFREPIPRADGQPASRARSATDLFGADVLKVWLEGAKLSAFAAPLARLGISDMHDFLSADALDDESFLRTFVGMDEHEVQSLSAMKLAVHDALYSDEVTVTRKNKVCEIRVSDVAPGDHECILNFSERSHAARNDWSLDVPTVRCVASRDESSIERQLTTHSDVRTPAPFDIDIDVPKWAADVEVDLSILVHASGEAIGPQILHSQVSDMSSGDGCAEIEKLVEQDQIRVGALSTVEYCTQRTKSTVESLQTSPGTRHSFSVPTLEKPSSYPEEECGASATFASLHQHRSTIAIFNAEIDGLDDDDEDDTDLRLTAKGVEYLREGSHSGSTQNGQNDDVASFALDEASISLMVPEDGPGECDKNVLPCVASRDESLNESRLTTDNDGSMPAPIVVDGDDLKETAGVELTCSSLVYALHEIIEPQIVHPQATEISSGDSCAESEQLVEQDPNTVVAFSSDENFTQSSKSAVESFQTSPETRQSLSLLVEDGCAASAMFLHRSTIAMFNAEIDGFGDDGDDDDTDLRLTTKAVEYQTLSLDEAKTSAVVPFDGKEDGLAECAEDEGEGDDTWYDCRASSFALSTTRASVSGAR